MLKLEQVQWVIESSTATLMAIFLFGWNSNKFQAVCGFFHLFACEKPKMYGCISG